MRIYVLGNPLVKEDSRVLEYLDRLKKDFPNVEFKELDPTEEIPREKNLIVIDTGININNIKIINDLSKLELEKKYSLHDFDLVFNLKLMRKLNLMENVTIIAVPNKECYDGIKKAVRELATE